MTPLKRPNVMGPLRDASGTTNTAVDIAKAAGIDDISDNNNIAAGEVVISGQSVDKSEEEENEVVVKNLNEKSAKVSSFCYMGVSNSKYYLLYVLNTSSVNIKIG